ncbi:hypothetical protein L6R29_19360 [Myxococcota bacterium]|nr:hypothetical protein [Myxococcota bacterium]
MTDRLVLIDFPSIKSFVFGTSPAGEIRGGSAILDQLNRDTLERSLKQAFPEPRHRLIYAGGGSALFCVKDCPNEREILDFLESYQRRVSSKSGGGLSIEYAICEQRGDFKKEVSSLHSRLAKRRYSQKAQAYPRSHFGMWRACASCAQNPAEYSTKDKDKKICRVCNEKRLNRGNGPAWKELLEYYGQQDAKKNLWRPESFNDIGAASITRKDYIALLYADGDAMGRIVKDIPNEETYRIFSKTVDGALRQATYETLKKLLPAPYLRKKRLILPADILLLGGDDLVMVLRVDLALRFAIQAAQRFQELTQKEFKDKDFFKTHCGNGLTISFGIAIARSTQPFRVVLEQAEELLKSAKRRKSEVEAEHRNTSLGLASKGSSSEKLATKEASPKNEPFLDLADVSQTHYVDLADIREEDLRLKDGTSLTEWPRSCSEAARFQKQCDRLIEAGLRKGRVNQLADLLFQEGSRTEFETYRLLTRLHADQRNALLEFFEQLGMDAPPWRSTKAKARRSTSALDFATLYPYIAEPSAHLEANESANRLKAGEPASRPQPVEKE